MATCGLPNCRSTVSDKSQGDTSSKGPCKPCCLPDCQNEASERGQASSSRARAEGRPAEQYCGLPGCMRKAGTEGKEVCLYRSRDTSLFGCLADSYKLFWKTWNKIRSDPYNWSLFKASVFFVLGLKLFADLAADFAPIPKCRRR